MNKRNQSVKWTVTRRELLTVCAVAGLGSGLAWGQEYPAKPIRLIVPFSPGGGVDTTARQLAPVLGELLKATVVVENKVGASGLIGSEFVARAAPDGHVLLYTGGSAVTIVPQTIAKSPFDPLKDLVPVNTVGGSPLVISAHPKVGIKDLKELIALSRTRQVTIASAGNGTLTHLTIELLSQASGGNILHVPYKGGGAAVVDALAGHVDAMVSDIPPVAQLHAEKRLVPLAVTSDKRVELMPNVPTANEVLPGFSAVSWFGMFAPAGTPMALVEKVSAAMVSAVANGNFATQLKKGGSVPASYPTPEAFRKFVHDEYSRWGKLVRERKIVTG